MVREAVEQWLQHAAAAAVAVSLGGRREGVETQIDRFAASPMPVRRLWRSNTASVFRLAVSARSATAAAVSRVCVRRRRCRRSEDCALTRDCYLCAVRPPSSTSSAMRRGKKHRM